VRFVDDTGEDRGHQVNIHGFARELRLKIGATKLTRRFEKEKDFEKSVLVESAWKLSRAHPEIHVFTHPWGRKAECKPTCQAAERFSDRVEGCKECWTSSKEFSVAQAFGMRHNFDLTARDRSGRRLVVEVKWLQLKTNRSPNGEFQRFIGQCTLAAAANDVVIGVCGLWGQRVKKLETHERAIEKILRTMSVHLIVLREA
jgi:hypothetical protein